MRYFQYTLNDLYKNSDRKEFNYITFFAGGGGSSCAYKLSGGDVKYMNEFQQIHVDTYLENFPNTTIQLSFSLSLAIKSSFIKEMTCVENPKITI